MTSDRSVGASGANTSRIVAIDLTAPPHREGLRQLLDEYARSPTGGGTPLSAAVLERLPDVLAARPHYFGWLAFDGQRPVGLINCFESVSTFRGEPLINVHDLIVTASHRRLGLGTALLAEVEAMARQRGCCKITLEVLSGNHGAAAAYQRVGFRPYELDPTMGQAQLLQKTFY